MTAAMSCRVCSKIRWVYSLLDPAQRTPHVLFRQWRWSTNGQSLINQRSVTGQAMVNHWSTHGQSQQALG